MENMIKEVLAEFGIEKEFSSEEASFAAYLFNTMKIQQLQIEKLQAELKKFQKQ